MLVNLNIIIQFFFSQCNFNLICLCKDPLKTPQTSPLNKLSFTSFSIFLNGKFSASTKSVSWSIFGRFCRVHHFPFESSHSFLKDFLDLSIEIKIRKMNWENSRVLWIKFYPEVGRLSHYSLICVIFWELLWSFYYFICSWI